MENKHSLKGNIGPITVSKVSRCKEKFCGKNLVLTYEINYPEFASRGMTGISKINSYYCNCAERIINRAHRFLICSSIQSCNERIKNGEDVLPYELINNFNVAENTCCMLSVYTDCYQFTGGAHGSTVRSSETWNPKTGCKLTIKDVCACPNKEFFCQVKDEIKRQISKNSDNYFENYTELVDQTFSPSQFYVEKGKLVIYFQQYDIAPYVTGIPTFKIPQSICSIS